MGKLLLKKNKWGNNLKVYKQNQFLVFDLDDGKTVKYDFAKKQGIRVQPDKPDINSRNYKRVVDALINQLYYRRRLESAGKKSK